MLKPKKKITRKEIKKDPVLEKISQAEHFLREKHKPVLYVTIAVAVVIVISIALIRSKINANREASGELGIAEMALAANDVDNAIVQLEALIDKNPKTKSAGMATVLLAQAYMSKDNLESAEIYYRKYVDDYADDGMLTATAYNGLGACAERREEYAQAAKYFEKGGDASSYEFLKYDSYLNAIRDYLKLKNVEKAEKLLKVIPKDNQDFHKRSLVETFAAELEVLKSEIN
jgi:tetratricopeptide (TPR) repeat protein